MTLYRVRLLLQKMKRMNRYLLWCVYSAMIYSITETARANGLNVYYYVKHLLTELLEIIRIDGSVDEKELESLMPWSKDLPAECYSKRRK